MALRHAVLVCLLGAVALPAGGAPLDGRVERTVTKGLDWLVRR